MAATKASIEPCGRPLAAIVVLEAPPDLLHRVVPMAAIGRQEEQLDPRMLAEPGRDRVRFVDAGVIEHDEQRLGGIRPQELLQEGDELVRPLVFADLVVPAPAVPLQRPEDRPFAVGALGDSRLLATAHPHRAQHRQQVHVALVQADDGRLRRGLRLTESYRRHMIAAAAVFHRAGSGGGAASDRRARARPGRTVAALRRTPVLWAR